MKHSTIRSRARGQYAGQRLGAVGMTVALGVLGSGALLHQCKPAAAKQSAAVSNAGAQLPVSAVVGMVNSYRAANGVGPVGENPLLDSAAENHSVDQANRQTMSHIGWNGSDAGQRISAAGYTYRTWGENVAAGQPDAASVMTAWMNSTGHRANILNPAFNEIGIAAVTGTNGTIYWTMDFATGR